MAAAFQEAVVDVCITKLLRGAAEVDAKTVVIGGGVAANSRLRTRLLDAAEADGRRAFLPSPSLCTDNGAMIAAAAWWRLQLRRPDPALRRGAAGPAAADDRLSASLACRPSGGLLRCAR